MSVLNDSDGLSELLTQEEAIRLLRLDSLGLAKPKYALRHLWRTRQIGYVKVAGKVLIPRVAIVAYLERQTVRALEGGVVLDGAGTVGSNSRRGGPEPRDRR
jgi:hypothetical protein